MMITRLKSNQNWLKAIENECNSVLTRYIFTRSHLLPTSSAKRRRGRDWESKKEIEDEVGDSEEADDDWGEDDETQFPGRFSSSTWNLNKWRISFKYRISYSSLSRDGVGDPSRSSPNILLEFHHKPSSWVRRKQWIYMLQINWISYLDEVWPLW